MGYQIISFLLDVAAGLLGGACLLRLYMQYQRIPFGNPVGRFVFALTDWLVLPLRRILPAVWRVGYRQPGGRVPGGTDAVRAALAAGGAHRAAWQCCRCWRCSGCCGW